MKDPFWDRVRNACKWLAANSAEHTVFSERVLPRLQVAVDEDFATWKSQAIGDECPALVMSVIRHLDRGKDPSILLAAIEKALAFYSPNNNELRQIAPMLASMNQSHHIILQCLVAAQALAELGPGRVEPPTGDRPDLIIRPQERDVFLEVTSHNISRDDRRGIASGRLPASGVDPFGGDTFREIESRIRQKADQYGSDIPVVLVLDEFDIVDDLLLVLEDKSFQDLLKHHGTDCTPLSALAFLPYHEPPEVIFLPPELSRGLELTAAEQYLISKVFSQNALSQYGLWPENG